MDNQPPQVNIIRSDSGKKFQLPRINPIVVILTTVLLAVVLVVSVALLYQKRQTQTPVAAPTSAHASTTESISSGFSDPKWMLTQPSAGTLTISGQNLVVSGAAASTGTANYSDTTTGDFSISVHVVPVTTGQASNNATLAYGDINLNWFGTSVTMYDNSTQVGSTLSINSSQASIDLLLQRIDGNVQGFVNTGNGNVLVGTTSYTADAKLQVLAGGDLTISNLAATYNPSEVQPTPIPGSTAACALNFTVLDIVPTNVPGPTVTPTLTTTPNPTATQTPGPTATPTPQPTPASCNNSCTTNADCSSNLICSGNVCRSPQCTNDSTCTCAVAVATPTPTIIPTVAPLALGPTPTPVVLQVAGDATGTIALGLGGAVILGLGTILMFVF